MNKKFITIDNNFLEEHVLLSTIMMEMIITQDKIAHARFVQKISSAAYGDLTEESLKSLEIDIRNYRELSILQGMQHIAVQMDIVFDHEAAYKFLSAYLLGQGDIEPPVSLSVSDIEEIQEASRITSLSREIRGATTPFLTFTDMEMLPIELPSLDVAVVSENTNPILSKPRGHLRAVK